MIEHIHSRIITFSLILLVLLSLFITSHSFQIHRIQNHHNHMSGDTVQMTQDDTSDIVRVLTIGDWGGLPYSPFFTMVQKSIASQLALLADLNRYRFILGLGDNFYYDGVSSIDDERFKETYEDVFTADSLKIPWFMLAGNHDHHGNISAQIAYNRYSTRWRMLDYNYSVTTAVGGRLARFIMLDTVVLCGLSDKDYLGQQPQGPENKTWAASMLQWLEKELSESNDVYLFVCGHYPVYSIGQHGPTQCLKQSIEPLLHKYNVTAYLNGHDHNLQHVEYTDNVYQTTVDYYTTGAANFIDPLTTNRHNVPANSSKFFWADIMSFGGFADIEMTEEMAVLKFYRADGKVLYSKEMKPRPRN